MFLIRRGYVIKKLIKFVPISIYLSILLMPFGVASAQSAGQGLEISPPLIEINTDPGKTVTANIKVRNITKEPLVARPQVNDFVAQGEEGQAKLLLDEKSKEKSPYSIGGWVGGMSELNIAPGEAKTATISINVPAGASPGGHYGVVRFTAAAPGIDSTGVALSASVGTLVLINVSGDIVDKSYLAEFFTSQNGKRGGFFQSGPVTFVERLKNEGNTHFKPTGTVRITNTFGKEVKVLSVNATGGNVLPASVRRFEQTLDKKRMFGHYKAEVNIQYQGKTLTQTIGFWVIPLKVTALVLGVIILLVLGLRFYVKQAVKRAAKGSKSSKK